MQNDILYLSNLKITANHEIGHAVVAKLFTWSVERMVLYTDTEGIWGGCVNEDAIRQFDPPWMNLDLDRYLPYRELHLQYPMRIYPHIEYKNHRDYCTYKCAGIAAEILLCEQLGVCRKQTIPDEDTLDLREARARIMRIFPPERWENELCNATARAREILTHPTCRRLSENLATELISSILEGKKPAEQDGLNKVYRFGNEEIYANFAQTLRHKR
jgi:hypothetical protein